jgi:hypothetical protein
MNADLNNEHDIVFHRLLVYLASPQTESSDHEMGGWIPSPAALAAHDRKLPVRPYGAHSTVLLGAEALLKLGRDDDAAEVARLGLLPEQHTYEKWFRAVYHGVLGRVAAKNGNAEDAGGHFGRALDEAKASRLPMQELLVARDWKRAVSGSGAAADAAIDEACAKMGKSRAALASVL